MVEVFKDIIGYEGLYQVSNLGRVKSLERTRVGKDGCTCVVKEKILKSKKRRDGYYQIHLNKDSKVRTFYLHRLVALAFIPNPLGLPEVNHKNEDKSDCSVSNLEWCDRKANCNHGTRNKRIAESHKKSIYCPELDRTFNSIVEAAKVLGCADSTIVNHLSGRIKSVCKKKYHLQYANEVAV